MADVRSLLRQQRAIRRIEHPHAAYIDAGKLLCTLCREQVKTESLWESHVQSETHARRLQSPAKANGLPRTDVAGANQKRKLGEDDADGEIQDAIRRKRSRANLAHTPTNGVNKGQERTPGSGSGSGMDANRTPPGLSRRTSTTPSQGIELQIPSRPATPSRRDVSASSTPGIAPRTPLSSASNTFLTPRPVGNSVPAAHSGLASSAAPQVDESEWAAFEADMAAESVAYDTDAVISAPAMTAEESAAAKASAEMDDQSRRAQADVDMEEEREEAARTMEDEFEDMHELEERVTRLKQRREALRRKTESHDHETASEGMLDASGEAAVTDARAAEAHARDEGDEEDDDDDDDDDWDGFRFRAS